MIRVLGDVNHKIAKGVLMGNREQLKIRICPPYNVGRGFAELLNLKGIKALIPSPTLLKLSDK